MSYMDSYNTQIHIIHEFMFCTQYNTQIHIIYEFMLYTKSSSNLPCVWIQSYTHPILDVTITIDLSGEVVMASKDMEMILHT